MGCRVRDRKVLEGLDFGGDWPCALVNENFPIEGNLRLPYVALSTVEDNTMFPGSLHQMQEVPVMLLRGMAEDAYIIINSDNVG